MINFITKMCTSIMHIYTFVIITHRDCLRFAFSDIIQADLNRTMDAWNTHRIRSAVNNDGGIPDELYFLPEISGKSYIIIIHNFFINIMYYRTRRLLLQL